MIAKCLRMSKYPTSLTLELRDFCTTAVSILNRFAKLATARGNSFYCDRIIIFADIFLTKYHCVIGLVIIILSSVSSISVAHRLHLSVLPNSFISI